MLRPVIRKMGYKIGRDKFIYLLRDNDMLIKRKRKYRSTTDSNHSYSVYSNLLKEIDVTKKNEVFVSDLTYLSTDNRFYYLSLVTDVYSRKIVGYYLSDNLRVEGSLQAFKQAISKVSNPAGLIHHSDRGFQYCSIEYVNYLKGKKIQISMSGKGNPYDNAIAERVIGILKQEYMLGIKFRNYKQMYKAVKEAINIYNTERPHLGIGMEIPEKRYAA
jgi:transposase InsO family protein